VVAGIRSALKLVERSLGDERIVFFGAGASGAGCELAMRAALRAAGVPERMVAERVLCIDSRGLILRDRPDLEGEKATIAADPAVLRDWTLRRTGSISLAEVVENYRPTILIGASGQPGAFTEAIIRAMHRGCPRPIILPISNRRRGRGNPG
jgi:malate dehydrogenase (oxaloacetate-decarboxylating)